MTGKAARLVSRESMSMMESRTKYKVKQEKVADLVFLKRMTGKVARLVSRERTSMMESRAK
jgi:hypothetical protein